MFCPHCGNQIADGAAFCSTCGAATTDTQQATPNYQQANAGSYPQDQFGGIPMNWFKFLIYFSLFAGAVLNAISGIMLLTGSNYEGVAELVYHYYDGLQALDIIIGLVILALAAFGIYVRFRLSGFRANGPQMLNYLYIAVCATNVIYLTGLMIITGGDAEIASSNIINLAVSVIMIFANTTYFNKRKHLFVNP